MQSYTVTLTSANTNYNLLTLVRLQSSGFIDVGDFVIQADDDSGTETFKLGDVFLDATSYGESMKPSDFSAHYRSLAGVYARCDEAGKKLHIQVIR